MDLIELHEKLTAEKKNYNNFETDEDLFDYCSNEDNYYVALNDCLRHQMQELAM